MRSRIAITVLLLATACRVPCSQGPPPLIVGPVNVAADSTRVTVVWYTDRPATTHVEYGSTTDYGASYEVKDLETEHWAYLSGTVPGATYHYRVRSVDSCGFEVVSDDATFTVPGGTMSSGGGSASPIDPPTLVAVPDGSGMGTVQVSLEWSTVIAPGGATAYTWVEVDDDPSFMSPLVVSGWLVGHEWPLAVQAGKTWYWRAKVQDPSDPQNVSAWSATDSFTITDTAALPTPAPHSVPDFVTQGMGGPVTFSWDPVKGPHPVEYLVQVSWSPDFTQIQAESGWIKATQWTTQLGAVGTWYWRVRARDSKHPTSVSAWTPTQSFYDIIEIQMKGSCPFVFVHDVSGWRYQTEIQGPAIGLPPSVLTTQNIHLYHPEHVVLRDMQKDKSAWRVKIRETQSEITYLDRLTLLVVDHPSGHSIAASTAESTYSYGYSDPFNIITTGKGRPPTSARDTSGKDALASLSEADGLAYTSTHPTKLLLDFGTIDDPSHARLLVTGWSAYDRDAYPSSSHVQPFIEVRDAKGKWVKARSFGNPAGDTKTMAIDISNIFPTPDHRIRIDMGTVHAIRWAIDQILLDDSSPVPFTVHAVDPTSASLSFAGRAPHTRATHEHPNIVEDGSVPPNPHALGFGAFTRYGDVLDLLPKADDMYVIMRHGDALEISFPDPPPPPPGFHRTLILEAVFWYKHFPLGNTVDPLPYLGMKTYPTDGYPMDEAHLAYISTWNTRVFTKPDP